MVFFLEAEDDEDEDEDDDLVEVIIELVITLWSAKRMTYLAARLFLITGYNEGESSAADWHAIALLIVCDDGQVAGLLDLQRRVTSKSAVCSWDWRVCHNNSERTAGNILAYKMRDIINYIGTV